MKLKSILIFAIMAVLAAGCALAETRAYSYEYSVRDGGVKFEGYTPGKIWYFTFNKDNSRIYMTDKKGMSSTQGNFYFQYSGTENGIHVYVEKCNTISFLPPGKIYFNSDFTRMNWDCPFDGNRKSADGTIVRVYTYKPDPDKESVPTHLY